MITYLDSVQYLYALGNELKTIKLGLERIRTLLAAMGHPERACRFVHVAGTNGKGSVCAMVESGLRAAGIRTGLYTSPHLVKPTERIRIGGAAVTGSEFAAAFQQVHECAEGLVESGRIDGHPTYFETVTAMAFLLFRDHGVEQVVLEVGLGGRLDATNVVDPEICAITPVDYDHENFLGSSIEAIAGEKAGILKPGVPAVIAAQHPAALQVISARAAEVGAPLRFAPDWSVRDLILHPQGCRFQLSGPATIAVDCPLAGEHQVDNARTAAVLLHTLGLPTSAIETGIRTAVWPGRLEPVAAAPAIILDGAHNPAAMRALARHIRRFYPPERVWIIYAAMRDKSIQEIGELLCPLASRIILTTVDMARALRPEAMLPFFDHPSVRTCARLSDALDIVRAEAYPADTVFITGSLFLVGEARAMLVREC